MDRMQYVEPARRDEILAEAAAQAARVVVTARKGKEWLTHKSHFLAPADGKHLLIAGPLTTEEGSTTALSLGEQIGVSFRRGHKKCMFGTVVEDLQHYPEAFVVSRPEQLQELQRRVYHRSSPPRGTTIDVRFWPSEIGSPSTADRPPDDALRGTLKDISVGGLRIQTDEQQEFIPGQTFICHFACKRGAPPISLEATLRHRQTEPKGRSSLGLQLVGLEATPAGRKRLVRLAKIVAEFQRSTYDPTDRPRRQP